MQSENIYQNSFDTNVYVLCALIRFIGINMHHFQYLRYLNIIIIIIDRFTKYLLKIYNNNNNNNNNNN